VGYMAIWQKLRPLCLPGHTDHDEHFYGPIYGVVVGGKHNHSIIIDNRNMNTMNPDQGENACNQKKSCFTDN